MVLVFDMITADEHPTPADFLFGPFCLSVRNRMLFRDSEPVEIGSRALDVLITIALRGNRVVSKDEIISAVWPTEHIEGVTLRSHINALRKALREGENGVRYVLTVPKRGYMLSTPVAISSAGRDGQIYRHGPSPLPAKPRAIYGRDADANAVMSVMDKHRLVSIVGPGGIGKTTLAIQIAHTLHASDLTRTVCFVDLTGLSKLESLVTTIAAGVGCPACNGDVSALARYLNTQRYDIVFDGCEHLISGVAWLVTQLLANSTDVRIVTTTREPLRSDGEFVQLLGPLALPGEFAAMALDRSPALCMFIEHARSGGYSDHLDEDDILLIANLCRQLDGIPLAIELVASRVHMYGLARTCQLVEDGAAISIQGKRDAATRHQSLKATIDWSYQLLSDDEKKILRRLSVFVGRFDLRAVINVAGDANGAASIQATILSLVDKSLVAFAPSAGTVHFRLLDSTRVCMAELLENENETANVMRRHARHYFRELRSQLGEKDRAKAYLKAMGRDVGNIRKALVWSAANRDEIADSAQMTAYASSVFLDLFLFEECAEWCDRAVRSLLERDRGGEIELTLQENLAFATVSARGITDNLYHAIERGLEISTRLEDANKKMKFLAGLQAYRLCRFDSIGASVATCELSEIIELRADPTLQTICAWSEGKAYHLNGDQNEALKHFKRGMEIETAATRGTFDLFGVEHRGSAISGFSRCLWVSGFPSQAIKLARQQIAEVTTESSVTYCHSLLHLTQVGIWCGKSEEFEPYLRLVLARPEVDLLPFYKALALSIEGELLLEKGQALESTKRLEEANSLVQEGRYYMLEPQIAAALATALAATDRPEDGFAYLDRALTRIGMDQGSFWLPDVLRAKADTLSACGGKIEEVSRLLEMSIDASRKQAARGWELKAAIRLARLLKRQDRYNEARDVMDGIISHFDIEATYSDLDIARDLQASLEGLVSMNHKRKISDISPRGKRPFTLPRR